MRLSRLAVTTASTLLAVSALTGCAQTPSAPSDSTFPTQTEVNQMLGATATFGQTLVGMTVEAAAKKATDAGYTVRIVEQDGQGFPITADLRYKRIDLHVVGNIVKGINAG
jgi:hypothetical protein